MRNDDSVLIQRILAGDAIAFEHLVRKYQKQVHTLAWRKIGDFHIAEDITQETFLQVYQKLETLKDPARFSRWLYVIADRLCVAWLRKNHRHTESLDDIDLSGIETEAYSRYIATEHANTIAEARRDLVEELIAKLKEGNRTVITLHYLEGMTYAEISDSLGVSENTIKSRLRRARQQLKKYEFMVQETLDIPIEGEHYAEEHLDGGFGMKLTLERDEFLDSLQALQSIASEQDTSPLLSNVLIHAEGSTIECMATDMEVGIRVKVEGAIKEEGTIVVSAKELETIVKAWPPEKPIGLATIANDQIEITSGGNVRKIVGFPDKEFPQFSSIDAGAFSIDGETLRSVLYKTEFAASTEKKRRFLNGLYFNLFEDRTEVVATDGIRLALAHCEPFTLSGESDGFIIPLKAVKEIGRNFANSPEVRISRVKNEILFADEHATLTARLIDAEYPNYKHLIPESFEGRAVVSRARILDAIHRVSPLANPENPTICLEIDAQHIRITPKTSEPDTEYETLAVASSTGSIRIGFDPRFLTGILAHIETQSLSLEFSGELDPVFVKPIGEEGQVYLVMPKKL